MSRSARSGNPFKSACFLDEDLNGKVKTIAATAHAARFEPIVIGKFEMASNPQTIVATTKRRKRRVLPP